MLHDTPSIARKIATEFVTQHPVRHAF